MHCALCRKPLTPETGTVLGLLGKPLFTVHAHPCADVVKQGASLVSLVALKGLHAYMAKEAPKLLQVVEKVNQLRQIKSG